MDILNRVSSELRFGDDVPRAQHNVNNENIKELVPYKASRHAEGWTVEICDGFWKDMLSEQMRENLRSFIENYDERASDGPLETIRPTHAEEDLSADVLFGLSGVDDSCTEAAPTPATPRERLHNTLLLCSDWAYPNTILSDASPEERAFSKAIYNHYLSNYDYPNWGEKLNISDLGIVDVDDLKLSYFILPKAKETDIAELTKLARTRVLSGRGLPEDFVSDFSNEFVEFIDSRIQYALGHGFEGVFAKISGKSAKNDVTMRPLKSVADVIENLTISKDIVGWLGAVGSCETGLVILPWNKGISCENEFRVFVKNGRPTGISKQRWWEPLSKTTNTNDVVDSVYKLCESLFPRLPFPTATLDVWYSPDSGSAYLIECNPWGAFFSSGSSLFSWVDHYTLLHDTSRITFAQLDKEVTVNQLPPASV